MLPPDTPRLTDVHLNWRVLLFTGVISLFTGCAFGLAPVLNALRLRLRAVLDTGGRGGGSGGRTRAAGAHDRAGCVRRPAGDRRGLLVRSLWSALARDPGFRRAGRDGADLADRVGVRPGERCLAFYQELDERRSRARRRGARS